MLEVWVRMVVGAVVELFAQNRAPAEGMVPVHTALQDESRLH
jgi:hypothetical protein